MKDETRKILVILLSLVALGCAAYLVWYYSNASRTKESYDTAKEVAQVVPEEVTEEDSEEKVEIPIDFPALQTVNPDVYAWIRIAGTNMDYPVVQNLYEDDFYLDHTWEGVYSEEGAIFSQSYNSKAFTDFNTVLYGHRMGGGLETMFYQLRYYQDAEFMDGHREIIVYTPEHILTYKVFAAVVYDNRHLVLQFDASEESGRQEFLDSIWNSRDMRNQFREDVEVTVDDRILTLSTCIQGESDHRLLIEAVLVDEK